MKTLKEDANLSQQINYPHKSPFSGSYNYRPISAANVRPGNILKSYNSNIK